AVVEATDDPWLLIILIPVMLVALFGAIAFFVIRLMFATPAIMLEDARVFASLSRSWQLTKGNFWRLFGIMLLTTVLVSILVNILAVPFSLIGSFFATQDQILLPLILSSIRQLVGSALSIPVMAAVLALLYVDVRMRREGLGAEPARAARGGGRRGPWGGRWSRSSRPPARRAAGRRRSSRAACTTTGPTSSRGCGPGSSSCSSGSPTSRRPPRRTSSRCSWSSVPWCSSPSPSISPGRCAPGGAPPGAPPTPSSTTPRPPAPTSPPPPTPPPTAATGPSPSSCGSGPSSGPWTSGRCSTTVPASPRTRRAPPRP